MCPNPVPHTETNESHNHCRHHHIPLSDGKPSFLFPGFVEGLCSVLHFSSNCGWKSGGRSKPAGGISLNNPNNGFFQTYLMAGYYFTATEHYDIKWTMPHCVLTLKLIGE